MHFESGCSHTSCETITVNQGESVPLQSPYGTHFCQTCAENLAAPVLQSNPPCMQEPEQHLLQLHWMVSSMSNVSRIPAADASGGATLHPKKQHSNDHGAPLQTDNACIRSQPATSAPPLHSQPSPSTTAAANSANMCPASQLHPVDPTAANGGQQPTTAYLNDHRELPGMGMAAAPDQLDTQYARQKKRSFKEQASSAPNLKTARNSTQDGKVR
jgi:hypothetical protein